jgi:hypothetical protein
MLEIKAFAGIFTWARRPEQTPSLAPCLHLERGEFVTLIGSNARARAPV